MIKKILILALFLVQLLPASEREMKGKHYIASFYDCDEEALANTGELMKAFEKGLLSSGDSIINTISHPHPEEGFAAVILLSKSHAAIRTYPEYRACFIDFFIAGKNLHSKYFDETLTHYLNPGKKALEIVQRD